MRRHRPDFLLGAITIVLLLLSLVLIYAIGPRVALAEGRGENYYFFRHLFAVILSIVAMIVGYRLPRKWLRQFAKTGMLVSLGLCLLVWVFGKLNVPLATCTQGACRWLTLGPLSFQTVELLKIAVLLYVPWLISDRKASGKYGQAELWIPLGALAGAIGLIIGLLQKDLGSTVVIYSMILVMLFVNGLTWKQVGAILLAGAAVIGLLILLEPHRATRLASWTGDSDDYHITNSLISLGTGGLFGVGLGNSISATGYLPESVSDSIFSIVGETWGLVGAAALLIAYAMLCAKILDLSHRAADREDSCLLLGVFAWIFGHVILNVGGMVGVIPMKGITLPFLSYGGTSMLFAAFAIGLALQVSQWTERKNIDEDIDSRGRQRGARYAGSRRRA